MRTHDLEDRLARRLEEPLPGAQAQLRLAPHPRRGWQPGHFPGDCRPGAGLLLLYPVDGEAHILLTERDDALPQHAGQVSLPGGAVEDDETIATAALREAEEEVGLRRAGVRVLGCLSPLHIPVSAFILHPVIGVMDEQPTLRPRAGEVARILETPVVHLADPQRWKVELRELGQNRYRIPFFDAQGAKLWGATAMVLAEFLEVAGFAPFCPLDPELAQRLP